MAAARGLDSSIMLEVFGRAKFGQTNWQITHIPLRQEDAANRAYHMKTGKDLEGLLHEVRWFTKGLDERSIISCFSYNYVVRV